MRRYYIELVDSEDGQYVLQSKWFSKKQYAINWAKNNIDFYDKDKCSLCLMTAIFDKEDECNYDIIGSENI